MLHINRTFANSEDHVLFVQSVLSSGWGWRKIHDFEWIWILRKVEPYQKASFYLLSFGGVYIFSEPKSINLLDFAAIMRCDSRRAFGFGGLKSNGRLLPSAMGGVFFGCDSWKIPGIFTELPTKKTTSTWVEWLNAL